MARCPYCHKILDDAWVKSEGAALMGKVGGKAKKRSRARDAAAMRWRKARAARKKMLEKIT